ncbi:MAG: hypothetical protein ACYCVA_05080 [Sulfobacillus sp.]
MGFHLTYGAVLASMLSPGQDPLALLPLVVPVALVVIFIWVGRSRPQFRRAIPLLVVAVLVAFTLPLGLVPMQESAAGWQVKGSTLQLNSPPDAATISLTAAPWNLVAMRAMQATLTKVNGFSDPTMETGTFQAGHAFQVVVLIYASPAQGVEIHSAGKTYLIATPSLPSLENALRQDSGPPAP